MRTGVSAPSATLGEPRSARQESPPVDVLELINLRLTARVAGQPVDLLRDVTLKVAPGEVLGLVGESGAGKSMVGRLIAGQVPDGFNVSRGRILFEGDELLALPPRERRALLGRRIAFIPQEPLSALNPVLTIGQTFGEHLAHLGVPAAERSATMVRELAAVRLPTPAELLRRYPHELSGGQCQRVLISMAFAAHPALIVADEPTTALDAVSQAHVLALLKARQRAQNSAVLLITHDLRLAAHVCDRIAVLYAGEAVEHGPAAEVLRRPRHPYTRALRDATPSLDGPRRRLPSLPGQMPGLAALAGIAGCRFAARCPVRDAACEQAPPNTRMVTPRHGVKCSPACESTPPEAFENPHDATGTFGDGRAAELSSPEPAPDPAPAGDPAGAPLVTLENVVLRYTARRGLFGQRALHTVAVAALNLSIRPGEFVGIVGESGSGKSSVARLIVGAEAPTEGRVRVGGHDRANASAEVLWLAREQVQMVFQDPHSALNPRRSVLQLLTQPFEVPAATGRGPREARALELLHDIGLPPDCLQRFPSQLSGGQKQRVNIGRALCVMPRLLVADEIVSGLDVSVQAQIINLLLALGRQHGIALLLISHDLAVVRTLCSRVLVMQAGVVVEEGPTERVFAQPAHPYTRRLIDAVSPTDTGIAWPPAHITAEARAGQPAPEPAPFFTGGVA